MTTPNVEHLARGWALIAEGAEYLSMAYASIDPPLARSGVPASLPAAVPEAGVPPPVSGPSFDELPPEEDFGPTEYAPSRAESGLHPQVEAGLGKCPVHGISWKIKEGGISKNGKPYKAFWKCSEKDGNTFCNEKPQKIWADTHPAERAA
jgi:hypothetical protein